MAQQRRGGFKRRKKVDYIAANKIEYVDYKDTELLSRFRFRTWENPSSSCNWNFSEEPT